MILSDLTEDELALYVLFMDESGIDHMEMTWQDHTNEETSGLFRVWPVQMFWWRSMGQKICSAGSRSVGKALDIDTPIYTTRGWRTMGTLIVGDFVFNELGEPTEVKRVHEIQYDRPCFEVEFDDGSKIVADEDHLWKTYRRKELRKAAKNKSKPSLGLETTSSIKDSLICAKENNHAVPVALPLQMEDALLPINPYTFGYWLGDGNSRSHEITVGSEDIAETNKLINMDGYWLRNFVSKTYGYALQMPEQNWVFTPYDDDGSNCAGSSEIPDSLIREVKALMYTGASIKKLERNYTHDDSVLSNWVTGKWRAGSGGFTKKSRTDMFRPIFEQLNVIQNKHIPEIYFQSSLDQRLDLFRGIMDSDGCARKNGLVEITFKSEKLCRDVRRLGLSLGQKMSKIEAKEAKCNGVPAGLVYRCTFTPINDMQPFKLKRKADRIKQNKSTRVTNRRIVAVRAVSSRPVRCIEVDSKSHLFLAGESLIPTHNSLSAVARTYAFPFVYAGEELVVTAPDGDRLTALTDKIETVFTNNWVANSMLASGPRGKPKHRPFHINYQNGARVMGRIPRHDGTGLQGTHPLILLHDEASTFPERGWAEIQETVKIQNPKARWLCYGVTMGPGNTFDDIINGKKSTWKVHKLPAMYRPNWTEKERDDKIIEYGGYESLDFKRNVLGTAIGADASLLSLQRLMGDCMDQDKGSNFNDIEYYETKVFDSHLIEVDDILELVDPPIVHTQYNKTWMGMDYGLTTSQSCILVFSEEKLKGETEPRLKLVCKIMMSRIPTEDQVRVVKHLMNIYRPMAFSFDAHGVGQPAYEWLQKEVRTDPEVAWMLNRIKGYSFSENIIWELDSKIDIDENEREGWKKAALTRKTGDYSLDILRLVVDTAKLWLPYDDEVLSELRSVPRKELMTMDEYGKPKRKKGGHVLDAFRFALLGWKQQGIEEIVAKYEEDTYEVPDILMLDFA